MKTRSIYEDNSFDPEKLSDMQAVSVHVCLYMHTNKLNEGDIFEILLEDVPEDEKNISDIEDDYEDPATEVEVDADSSAIDRMFDQELGRKDNTGSSTETDDGEPLPSTSPVADIDRKWRKKVLETEDSSL